MSALDVYFHRDRVGRLERLEQSRLRFRYEDGWVARGGDALSLALPLRREPFEDAECKPFFSGLLPEGDFLRGIARAFGVSAENPFSVLAAIGGECAGAISLVEEGKAPPFVTARPTLWPTEEELAAVLAELPGHPLLLGSDEDEEGVSLSLAGARDKLPVLMRGGKLGITHGDPPSTHIVKVPIADFAGMVANEAFCLALAAEVGLATAAAVPIRAAGMELLLVERYDRIATEGAVLRVHQEDICQALGCLPAEKYQADGGPGVADIGRLLRRRSAVPALDLLAVRDALLFNLLIRNGDAHAKNYSLLLEGDGSPRLAPLYDLISTVVYGRRYGRKMAMKYGGEYRAERIRRRHLVAFAAELEISAPALLRRAAELAGELPDACEAARARLPEDWQDDPVLTQIEAVLDDAAGGLRAAVAEKD